MFNWMKHKPTAALAQKAKEEAQADYRLRLSNLTNMQLVLLALAQNSGTDIETAEEMCKRCGFTLDELLEEQ